MADQTYDPNNIFAKILRGEIPSHRVYEDDDVVAFMDVMPQGKGHTLVRAEGAVAQSARRRAGDARPAHARRCRRSRAASCAPSPPTA